MVSEPKCSLFQLLFPDLALTDLKQEAYWVTGWGIHMPWIGLDTEGCGYLKNNCTSGNVSGLQKFSYPIHIMKEYPRVSQVTTIKSQLYFDCITSI